MDKEEGKCSSRGGVDDENRSGRREIGRRRITWEKKKRIEEKGNKKRQKTDNQEKHTGKT